MLLFYILILSMVLVFALEQWDIYTYEWRKARRERKRMEARHRSQQK